jgi:hypothetical protein
VALMRTLVLACLAVMLVPRPSAAQPPAASAELSIAGGASTQKVEAAATQIRLFGEVAPDFRFYIEGAWASRSGAASDAFGAAYPYDKRVRAIEVYGEKIFRGETLLAGVRAGRYRTPFGIYGRSDHAYSGFLRAPLIRYDGHWALSNNYLEGGVDLFAGRPGLQVETSLGIPQDVGTAVRRRGLDRVVRVQGYRGAFIAGVSHARSNPYERRSFARGEAVFTGVDLRWMLAGTQLRGEWITGQPFDGPSTRGWYVDAIVHRPALGPVTLVARAEDLDYDAGAHSRHMRRYTAGARAQLSRAIVGHVNAIHEPSAARGRRTSLDVALIYVVRYPW